MFSPNLYCSPMHTINVIVKHTRNTSPARLTRLILLALAISLAPLSVSTTHAASKHVAAGLPPININDGFAELVKAVKPAVVTISITTDHGIVKNEQRFGRRPPELDDFFRRFFGDTPEWQSKPNSPKPDQKPTAAGSGFIVDSNGLVVTNHHVIEGADEIEIVLDDGTRYEATLKSHDQKTDLALLKIKADKPLPFVKFGDSDSAQVGDWVVAIGNPFGLGGTTTSGIISARGRDIQAGLLDDFIQIDAPINRGNSGGPLFNTKGEVIGVNSMIFSPNGGNVGIGFAIPASMASDVIAQLRDHGVVQRGFLGVHIQTVSQEISDSIGLEKPIGALVTQVVPESPAAKAGLESGDVILTYDGKEVTKMRDLPKLVALTKDQTRVKVKIWRNDKPRILRVTISNKKEEEIETAATEEETPKRSERSEFAKLGLSVSKLTRGNREQYGIEAETNGVVITAVDSGSTAARRGLGEGDVITRIDNRQINSVTGMKTALKAARKAKKKSVLLLVARNGNARFLVLPLG